MCFLARFDTTYIPFDYESLLGIPRLGIPRRLLGGNGFSFCFLTHTHAHTC